MCSCICPSVAETFVHRVLVCIVGKAQNVLIWHQVYPHLVAIGHRVRSRFPFQGQNLISGVCTTWWFYLPLSKGSGCLVLVPLTQISLPNSWVIGAMSPSSKKGSFAHPAAFKAKVLAFVEFLLSLPLGSFLLPLFTCFLIHWPFLRGSCRVHLLTCLQPAFLRTLSSAASRSLWLSPVSDWLHPVLGVPIPVWSCLEALKVDLPWLLWN